MYDELIKNLRHDSAPALQNCEFDFVHSWMLQAADAIEELEKQLDEEAEYATALACNVPHWIPVTEQLPLLNTPVLATDGIEVDISWMYGVPPRWITSYTAINEDKLTHWMPLPQTPKDGEE